MADNFQDAEPSELSVSEKKDIVDEARKQYERARQREDQNILRAYDDLRFLAGEQWPPEVEQARRNEGRPCLTINQLPQFIQQVTGDIRQMRPAVKVVPVDDQGDPKLADLRSGLIRYIENRSDAEGVYFQTAESQVACGIGHWRILTEYADDSTFEQEIRVAGIEDGISVLWDPDASRPTREDAEYCFVPVDMTHALFKKKYPKASLDAFDSTPGWRWLSEWWTDDHIRVAEYWLKKPTKKKLALTANGETIDLNEQPEAEEQLKAAGARIEERETYQICRYLITASDVLEGPTEWPGRYIPVVPVIGRETRIGRRLIREGLVRQAKDPQRMYNFYVSADTEIKALQPKAPFLLTEDNVGKYQGMWETANTKNLPYLVYTPDSANGGAPPQRVAPPISSQGITEGIVLANENLRRVIGIYDASLGAKSNETSGKAIMARQREGDTGTYVYIDNFTRAIRHTGKILIDLIPHVYDSQRTIRIMGDDGKLDILELNKAQDAAGLPLMDEMGQPITLNDLSVGSYDVVAEVGPSYATKREYAKDSMIEFMRTVPQLAPMMMDLVAKAQDWPNSEAIAKRARALIPPQVLAAEQADENQPAPPPPQEGPPPDPEKMAKAQREQQGAQIDAAKGQQELQLGAAKMDVEGQKAQLELQKMQIDLAIKMAQLQKMQQPAQQETY